MLLSPAGLGRQALGNAATVAWQPGERAVAGALAGVFDRSGKADVPTFRESFSMLRSYKDNLKSAFSKAAKSVNDAQAGETAQSLAGGAVSPAAQGGNAYDRVVDKGFRLLSVFDVAAKHLAAGAEEAALVGRNDRRQRAGESTLTPEQIKARVIEVGKYRTLVQDLDDHFSKGVEEMRKSPLGKVVVPFWQIPYNGMKYDLERTPLGLAKHAVESLTYGRERAKNLDRTEYYERWARGALGSALSLGLLMAYASGRLTGPEPDDPEEYKQWRAEGKTPFSVKVAGRWLPVTMAPGLNGALTQAATVGDFWRRHDLEGRKWSPDEYYRLANRFVTTTAQYSINRPFFEGVAEILNAGSRQARGTEDGLLDTLGEQASGMAVPGVRILRDIERATSSVDRAPRDLAERRMAGIPGLSGQVPVKRDPFGRTVTRTGSGAERFLNPLVGKDAKGNLPRRYEGASTGERDTAIAEAVKAVKAEADAKDKGITLPASARPTQRQRNLAQSARENDRYGTAKTTEKERLEKERSRPSNAARLVGAR